MQGMILPLSLRGFRIYTQFSSDQRKVVDNYGDADSQVGLPAALPNSAVNRLGKPVTATGSGLSKFEVVDHKNLANSPHDTLGLQLAWAQPDVLYTSGLGGVNGVLTDSVGLRIGEFYPDDVFNPPSFPTDGYLRLSDGTNEASVRARFPQGSRGVRLITDNRQRNIAQHVECLETHHHVVVR